MLVQEIEIVRVFRLQVGIAERNVERICGLIQNDIGNKVVWIWTGKASAIDRANVGIRSNLVAKLDAGKRVNVPLIVVSFRRTQPVAGIGVSLCFKTLYE